MSCAFGKLRDGNSTMDETHTRPTLAKVIPILALDQTR